MVTSKNVGLSVPDWPTSFGYFMWSLPFRMWKGGILYEHSHRIIASTVGCLTLILAIWLRLSGRRRGVQLLGAWALVAVVIQGILGGITVKYLLPTAISVAHGMLAQIFLLLTVALAYSQSREYAIRQADNTRPSDARLRNYGIVLMVLVFVQLGIGAIMRHGMKEHGGVSVPDFPKVAGGWLPSFTPSLLDHIHQERFQLNWKGNHDLLVEVTMFQVVIHVIHRLWAFVLFIFALGLTIFTCRRYKEHPILLRTMHGFNSFLLLQMVLGAFSVWTQKGEIVTSLHVVNGAIVWTMAFLLVLRAWPAVVVTTQTRPRHG